MSDVDEIRRTLALYSRFNDEKDSTAWSQLWTESGSVSDRSGTYTGRPEIKHFVDGINQANPDRDTLHFCANSAIALDGDVAWAHTDIVFVSRPTNPLGSWAVGNINHYTDRLVRVGSSWLFQDRRIDRRPTVRTPLAELPLGAQLDDHEAIRRTVALYAQMRDSKDPAGCSRQFATSGTLHSTDGDYSGPAEIERYIAQQLAQQGPAHDTAHLGVNSIVDVDGDSAQVFTDYLVYGKTGEMPWSIERMFRAHDRLSREDGAWRFTWKEG
jgi:hypothetical protein